MLENKKILLVEDDESISELLVRHLTKEGFIVTTAFNGEEGITIFLKDTFDLVVLDIMIPKLTGIEVMNFIRSKSLIPILITSAKDTDIDKAIGLGLGADDYISKPFSLVEISARIKAIIRRATQYSNPQNKNKANIIYLDNLLIDIDNYSVIKNEENIKLTSKEFDILKLLVSNPKRVFTKAQIFNIIWNDEYYGDENIINVHIRRLREKIEDEPSNPQYIKTLWGIGYKLGEF